jgi:hypothetical protein
MRNINTSINEFQAAEELGIRHCTLHSHKRCMHYHPRTQVNSYYSRLRGGWTNFTKHCGIKKTFATLFIFWIDRFLRIENIWGNIRNSLMASTKTLDRLIFTPASWIVFVCMHQNKVIKFSVDCTIKIFYRLLTSILLHYLPFVEFKYISKLVCGIGYYANYPVFFAN